MSESPADRWMLEVVDGSRPSAAMPRAGVLVVGSDPKRAGYVVKGERVDASHCAIGRTKGGGFALKDLGSASGTLVNGKRVESARLEAGDVIEVGSVRLRVVDPERPNRVAPRVPSTTDTSEFNAAELDASEMSKELSSAEVVRTPPARPSEEIAPRTQQLPTVPGYRIERRLGRGGMGDVYLAVQESLARQVALKLLASRFEADREFVRRFQAEARSAAALNHPNVVTVYDVGETNGTHYLSMEYMDRGNFEDRLKNGAKIGQSEVLDILRDATSGLVYAESRGIVHRDLKPANLMQNHVGATKIADLGLATHVESEEAQTGDKKVFGTPHFMSPEQARGERVDSRSDLYSLGATAYRLLTGKTPFEGKDAREIVRALLREEPRSMREFAPEISDGVVALVERLMKKDASQRFTSAAEALAEIERLRNPAQHSVTIAASEPRKRSKTGVLLLLLLVGGGAWYWWQSQKPPIDPKLAGRRDPGPSAPNVPAPPKDPVANANPKPAASGTTTPDKDDKDLQLLEANAKLALLELMSREMPETERREALRSMASQFQGTSAATDALEKADEITNRIVSTAAASSARKGEVDALLAKLRAAARIDDVPPHPGRSFLSMRAVEGQAAFKDERAFVDERKTIETIVSRTAIAYAQQQMTEASQKLDKGDFEAGRKQLEELMALFDLPEFPMGEAPGGVTELYEIGRTARERLHTIEASREVFERKRDRDDALAIARGFGGASGLERELRALDFPAAKKRIEGLLTKVGNGPSLAFLRELAADCERAKSAIEALARECSNGGWRRKSFTDPREKRAVARNAAGADATGLYFEGDGGAADHVPWSAFGGNTKELSKLFFERCTRDWTAEELRGIAALLRIEACVEAVDVSAKMFDGARKANFTDANQRDMVEPFNVAATWGARAPEEKDEIAKEAEAGQLLATALRQATDAQWSTSVAAIERLLLDFQGTLLVHLLSNGLPPDAPPK